jgi:hypothetical protein
VTHFFAHPAASTKNTVHTAQPASPPRRRNSTTTRRHENAKREDSHVGARVRIPWRLLQFEFLYAHVYAFSSGHICYLYAQCGYSIWVLAVALRAIFLHSSIALSAPSSGRRGGGRGATSSCQLAELPFLAMDTAGALSGDAFAVRKRSLSLAAPSPTSSAAGPPSSAARDGADHQSYMRLPTGRRAGLRNVGNTCFANVVLQLLAQEPLLATTLASRLRSLVRPRTPPTSDQAPSTHSPRGSPAFLSICD